MDAKCSRLENEARSIEQTIPRDPVSRAALEATIKSAELYLQALRLTDTPSDRTRINAKCKQLLAQAERLKAHRDGSAPQNRPQESSSASKAQPSPRELTTREKIVLLEGAKLNSFIFREWTGTPSPDEFTLKNEESPFTDATPLPLSSTQLESFDGWKRPHEALSPLVGHTREQLPSREAMTHSTESLDLVQDMTSDCSVVASLCALTSRVERGHLKVLRPVIHPYDCENDRISISPNGKYILKLYFNGCWRRVEIDDYLPTSKTSRVLHVIDRRHPGLLWPALVEKAYLKVRGGYDFPGSNSGTDLAVLTGWIPQQIFLYDEDFDPDRLWEEIITHFRNGDVLITIGTGRLSRREQKQMGLVAEHDYAILDLNSEGDVRELLIKNPWADGDVWRGAARRRPNRDDDNDPDTTTAGDDMMPGTFWLDLNRVRLHFENMYINWNPALFSYRQDIHFPWQQGLTGPTGDIFIDNPQFAIKTPDDGEVWLLVSRHFRTGDYTQASAGKNGYISLYLYSRDGNKVISSKGAKLRGPFVDSPNTLLRFTATARTTYTAVLVAEELPAGKLNFTISAFSKKPVVLSDAELQYSQKHSIQSAWKPSNAGGNSDSADYLLNPQFRFSLNVAQKIALVLRVDADAQAEDTDIHVKAAVVYSEGSRITRLRARDVIAHSGDYRRTNTVIETELQRGNYTVICSTFDRNQHAKFSLDLYSSSTDPHAGLTKVREDGDGRYSIKPAPAIFTNGVNRILAPLIVSRLSRVTFVARRDLFAGVAASQTSMFKMTVEQGQGPYKRVIASSEIDSNEFSFVTSWLRIENVDLQPSMCGPGTGGLWLVLERLAPGGYGGEERHEFLGVEIFTDERIELRPWGVGDG
ncbi:hypothetical protein A1O3_09279 [Capronia epimyces CBS 606.96]|uniref:Calpain catalytic domain-containing protein n=1 Tax=Capronia epimyces CBS 606.96 TaxID=1182542 RepID=W9XD27_9EURO|nr:uncharacterized protein A1O3_09279 [Capronia epimyces CBS 606.96]EXJ78118.1 hypothetical protein A1O3_09279 [Capronia epimyces CBS 606.96]